MPTPQGNESAPIQLAQCWFPGLAISNAKISIYFSNTEAILSNSTRKLLWFEITKMRIAVLRNKFIVSSIIIFGTLSFPVLSAQFTRVLAVFQRRRYPRRRYHFALRQLLQYRAIGAVAHARPLRPTEVTQSVTFLCRLGSKTSKSSAYLT